MFLADTPLFEFTNSVLLSDLSQIVDNVKADQAGGYTLNFTKRARSTLLRGLKELNARSVDSAGRLLIEGMKTLDDEQYWLDLEISAKALPTNLEISFCRSVHVLVCGRKKTKEIIRPSVIEVEGKRIGLLPIYRHSFRLGQDFKRAAMGLVCRGEQAVNTKVSIIQAAQTAVNRFIRKCPSRLLQGGLSDMEGFEAGDWELVYKDITPAVRYAARSAVMNLLRCHDPERFERIYVEVAGSKLDITDACKRYPILIEQISVISKNDYFSGRRGHVPRAIRARLSYGLRILLAFVDSDKSQGIEELLLQNGLGAIIVENFYWLKRIKNNTEAKDFNALKSLASAHLGREIKKTDISNNYLSFHDYEKEKRRYINIETIFSYSEKLFNEIREIHDSEICNLPNKDYGIETLHTRFSKLIRIFSCREYFCEKKRNLVDIYGMKILSIENHIYQRELLHCIQSDVNSGRLSRRVGTGYFETLRWILSITNQSFVDSFRISLARHAMHSRRLRVDDTYTDDEIRELAFYIEKLRTKDGLSQYHRLLVYWGRVQLKTCWNTSCLARLEVDDIVEIDSPSHNKPIKVVLQKPRKGYQSDVFIFDLKVPKSAIHDLIYVRDVLTQDIRSKYSNSSFSGNIFLYEAKGIIKAIDNNTVTSYLSNLLKKNGCTIAYNSEKVRKTGANYTYKSVLKNIDQYKEVLRHDYQTFLKHYQRICETETHSNLHKAVQIMGDYFSGREICSDIKILTEDDPNLQITPIGLCASDGNDQEAKQYNKEHINIDRPEKEDQCGDFLACVWCKYYRTVADSDHVWQLISFRDYVLGDMKSTTAHFSSRSSQRKVFNVIEDRINSILEGIERIDCKAFREGQDLTKFGKHPSWSYLESESLEGTNV